MIMIGWLWIIWLDDYGWFWIIWLDDYGWFWIIWFGWLVLPAISPKKNGFFYKHMLNPSSPRSHFCVGLSLWQAGEWSSHWTPPCDSRETQWQMDYHGLHRERTNNQQSGFDWNQPTTNGNQPTLQAFDWKGDFFLQKIKTPQIPSDIWASTQRIQRIEGQRRDHKGLFCERKKQWMCGWHTRLVDDTWDSTQEFTLLDAYICLWYAYDPILSYYWKEMKTRVRL